MCTRHEIFVDFPRTVVGGTVNKKALWEEKFKIPR